MVDHVVEQVRDNIESGAVKPGERLPAEHELCDQFGVSRTVVREATRRLQSLGLVEVRRGHGVFVGDRDSVRGTLRVIRSALAISLADMQKFNDLRMAIESHTARQAALKATAADVAQLQTLCDRLVAGIEKGEGFEAIQEMDIAFHLQVATIAGNDLISQILLLVRDMMKTSMERTSRANSLLAEETRHWHQAIVDAIRDRDAARAEQAVRDHMEAVQQRLVSSAPQTHDTTDKKS